MRVEHVMCLILTWFNYLSLSLSLTNISPASLNLSTSYCTMNWPDTPPSDRAACCCSVGWYVTRTCVLERNSTCAKSLSPKIFFHCIELFFKVIVFSLEREKMKSSCWTANKKCVCQVWFSRYSGFSTFYRPLEDFYPLFDLPSGPSVSSPFCNGGILT